MATMLPIQSRFDKEIPQDYGNAEYLQERELLIVINDIIALSDLEHPVIEYFLDVACVNKYISVWGTGKAAELTSNERRLPPARQCNQRPATQAIRLMAMLQRDQLAYTVPISPMNRAAATSSNCRVFTNS